MVTISDFLVVINYRGWTFYMLFTIPVRTKNGANFNYRHYHRNMLFSVKVYDFQAALNIRLIISFCFVLLPYMEFFFVGNCLQLWTCAYSKLYKKKNWNEFWLGLTFVDFFLQILYHVIYVYILYVRSYKILIRIMCTDLKILFNVLLFAEAVWK